MRDFFHFPLLALAILSAAPVVYAQATATGSVTIGAEAGLTIPATPVFSATGGPFGTYTGLTNLTYFIRTSQSAGSGSIQMKVTTDFTPAGGPAVSASHL